MMASSSFPLMTTKFTGFVSLMDEVFSEENCLPAHNG